MNNALESLYHVVQERKTCLLYTSGFGRCRFALAVKKGTSFYEGYRAKQVATKYPNIARSYFEGKSMDVSVIKIEGSVELAPCWGWRTALWTWWRQGAL